MNLTDGDSRIMNLHPSEWHRNEEIADATRWWYGAVMDDESIKLTQRQIDQLENQYDLARMTLDEIAERHRGQG